jgi:hypothetical protein
MTTTATGSVKTCCRLIRAAADHTGIPARTIHATRGIKGGSDILRARDAVFFALSVRCWSSTQTAAAFGCRANTVRKGISRCKTDASPENLALLARLERA